MRHCRSRCYSASRFILKHSLSHRITVKPSKSTFSRVPKANPIPRDRGKVPLWPMIEVSISGTWSCSRDSWKRRAIRLHREFQGRYIRATLAYLPKTFITHRKILKSSSISESPGKSGCLLTISANMHPIDHTSTGVE